MDAAGFQGMPRFALTPAEEALVPRPHSSASQVATAVPSTYTRRGSSSATPSSLHSRHHRPQYLRKHNENNSKNNSNHPYSSVYAGSNSSSNPLGLQVSFSSSSVHKQHHQSPSPSSPIVPSTIGLPSDTDEQEYPQNPQDHLTVLSPLPVHPPSQGQQPPPRRSFSLIPRANRPASPLNSSDHYSPTYPSSFSHAFHSRGSLDSFSHRGSTVQLSQTHQESWDSPVRVESPEPLSDSDDSYNASKDNKNHHHQPRRSSSQGFFGGRAREEARRGSTVAFSNNASKEGSLRISLESERPNRNNQDPPEGLPRSTRTNISGKLHDLSDEERQESRRSRSGWRPSLSLIRQESSSFSTQTLQQPRRYLQNDQRRVSDMATPNNPHPTKNRRHRQKRKGPSRKRPRNGYHDSPGHIAPDEHVLPDLFQVLKKRTLFPLSYDDFEAFLRRQPAVEYLNFWTDVTAHEQLCRAFNVSERRFKRELQLEDRAIARGRRHQALDASLEKTGHFSPDSELAAQSPRQPGTGKGTAPIDAHATDSPGLNNSNLYITSRSSLQLPLNDHLSFPPETRRYGLQDSSSPFPPMPPSLAQRRGSEQRHMGAYNRLLAGAGSRRTSLERSRYSLDESPISEHQSDSTVSTPGGSRIRAHGSVDALGNSRLVGRRPSATEEHFHHRIAERPAVSSPLNPSRPGLRERSVQEEMDQISQAVEESIQFSLGLSQVETEPMPQASVQSLRIVEPALERKPSVANFIFDGGHGPLLPPLSIRRSGESAYAPSHYSTVHDGRTLLAQSYRTISLEDLEESVLRIYRKYLVQLRTLSMAAEEEAVTAVASKEANSSNPYDAVIRDSLDKPFAPGWDGYAEQVITEWNEKWRRRDSNARRARRTSARKSVSGGGVVAPRQSLNEPTSPSGVKATGTRDTPMETLEKSADNRTTLDQESQEDDSQDTERAPKGSKRPKLKRETTETGITAFLSRLLRTETTVVELPTLTVNMTTVEEDYDHDTDESEYGEDDEYDSDDEQEEDDTLEDGGEETSRQRAAMTTTKDVSRLEFKAPKPLFMKDRSQDQATSLITDEHYNTLNDLLAGDRAISEAGTNDSAIPLQTLFARPSVDTPRQPMATLVSTEALSPAALSAQTRTVTPTQALGASVASTVTAAAPQSLTAGSSKVAASAVSAAFYLPLECRQRIHAQVQQEGRTDAPHLFGPAKNFVVDVVLREHYYPLFLEYVKTQNLGMLHENHINNRIKRQGLIYLGVALWAVVVAVQITLVMMGWGGWSSPWVWIVGIVGGYPGSLFLTTGLTKFSPVLGLVGTIAEDKRVARFRRTMEPSIVNVHRKKAMRMLSSIVVCSSIVTVVFAALPQRKQQ